MRFVQDGKTFDFSSGGESSGQPRHLCHWIRTSTHWHFWLLHLHQASTNHGHSIREVQKKNYDWFFFSDEGTWLYSTLASEQVQHLHRFGFFWNPNPLLILCDCRWGQTKPSISSVPGQQTEPEQHLRPTLRFHQHVFWTTSQGEVLHARSKDVWGYSEMRCQTKNQFVFFLTS